MSKKETELQKFHRLYGYDPGSVKFVPKGGDILEYIGNDVIYVSFTKDSSGNWSSDYKNAKILSISDYEPVSMSYKIKYWVEGLGQNEWKEERIIPEAFSLDFLGAGVQQNMNRFVPRSIHCKLVETEIFYSRLFELFTKRDTMPISGIKSITGSKEQAKTLQYCCNIGAVIKAKDTGKILYFRIGSMKLRNKKKDVYVLIISDLNNNKYTLEIGEHDKSYNLKVNGEEIGELKIIDLLDYE